MRYELVEIERMASALWLSFLCKDLAGEFRFIIGYDIESRDFNTVSERQRDAVANLTPEEHARILAAVMEII